MSEKQKDAAMEVAPGYINGSAEITLSDGTKVAIPSLKEPFGATAQDIENMLSALLEMVGNLDKRLAALEKTAK